MVIHQIKSLIFCLAVFLSSATFAGGWAIISSIDGFSDKSIYQATLLDEKEDTTLGVQCSDDSLTVFVTERWYLNNDSVWVRLRFDQGEVYGGIWTSSADGVTVIANSRVSKRNIPLLFESESLLVETQDYRGVKYQSIFSLMDNGPLKAMLIEQCGLSSSVFNTVIKRANISESATVKDEDSFEVREIKKFVMYSQNDNSGYRSLACLMSDLTVLGYLDSSVTTSDTTLVEASLEKYLSDIREQCLNDVDDITLEMRCEAKSYSGLLKYVTNMAAAVSPSVVELCR